jgi:general secretion pathway protein D
VVTGSVQYQEVGLKLEFEPQIYSSSEVGIKLNLEVSNIVSTFTDPQGGRSYQIGTRSAQTSLRLRDGETQVLGGLIGDQDRYTANKIPGPGHLPVVGALFGNNNSSHTKTEIVLSITPRIIRAPANVEAALRDIFSGTESSIRERALRLDAVAEFRGGASPVPTTTPPAKPAAAAGTSLRGVRSAGGSLNPSATPNAAAGSPEEHPTLQGGSEGDAAPTTPTAVPASALRGASAAAPPRAGSAQPPATVTDSAALPETDFNWVGPATARVGETFTLSLNAVSLPALRDMPLTVRFDPTVLRFESASLGSLAQGAGAAEITPTIDSRSGRVELPLSFSQPRGMSGDGPVLELTFTVQRGTAATQVILAQNEAGGTAGGSRFMLPGPRSLALRIVQ